MLTPSVPPTGVERVGRTFRPDQLVVGDVVYIPLSSSVRTVLPRHFLFANRRCDWTLEREIVSIRDELAFLAGHYIVTDVRPSVVAERELSAVDVSAVMVGNSKCVVTFTDAVTRRNYIGTLLCCGIAVQHWHVDTDTLITPSQD